VQVTKAILKMKMVRFLGSYFAAAYIAVIYLTTRWITIGEEIPKTLWKNEQSFILAFWHNRLLMMPKIWSTNKVFYMLVSQHRDGVLISRAINQFGVQTIAGSSTKGGVSAFKRMLTVLKTGCYVGITPDGPHGPRRKVQEGVISLARISDVPIIPAAYSISRCCILNTWDKFMIPLPFSQGVFVWGKPLTLSRDANDVDQLLFKEMVETAINNVTDEADQLSGHGPMDQLAHPLKDESKI